MSIPVLGSNDLGGMLGAGFGQGLSEGLNQHFENKRNRSAANSLFDQLEGPEEERESFVNSFGGMAPDQQLAALKQLHDVRAQMQSQSLIQRLLSPQERVDEMDVEMDQAAGEPVRRAHGQLPELSPQERTALSVGNPQLAKFLQSEDQIHNKKQAAEQKEIRDERRETAEYRKSILDSFDSYRDTEMHLDRMEELNKEGNLTAPWAAQLSESLNIPISVISNPQSEEFQKLSQDLARGVTKAYRGRILQSEFQTFMKTLPTLLNSKEGRERVIQNMKILQMPQKLSYDAYRDIVKEQGGRVPFDIQERVQDRIAPELDKLASQFKAGSSTKNQTFSKLPSPASYKNKVIQDEETGARYKSNGTAWKKIE
jgi:hypothetical protein